MSSLVSELWKSSSPLRSRNHSWTHSPSPFNVVSGNCAQITMILGRPSAAPLYPSRKPDMGSAFTHHDPWLHPVNAHPHGAYCGLLRKFGAQGRAEAYLRVRHSTNLPPQSLLAGGDCNLPRCPFRDRPLYHAHIDTPSPGVECSYLPAVVAGYEHGEECFHGNLSAANFRHESINCAFGQSYGYGRMRVSRQSTYFPPPSMVSPPTSHIELSLPFFPIVFLPSTLNLYVVPFVAQPGTLALDFTVLAPVLSLSRIPPTKPDLRISDSSTDAQ
ncbi:hypothetical protein C8R44DRAFT_869113 [Mycena epipterygia]|nr:hypothetical protein C8R44DRAFT_869113 [Mycena epipterygia]